MLPQTILVVTAALTLKSDTTPVKVYVKKPRGTLYWGGAGLDGSYIKPQLEAFQNAGIKHVYVGLTNSASHTIAQVKSEWKDAGTLVDAARAGLTIRYEDDGDWTISSGMSPEADQFNLVGYSYGSLLAAQTANFYAKKHHIVDHLVLIGSPIDRDFLALLKKNKNIKKVIVINLTEYGDPIYAGIGQFDLATVAPMLGKQMAAQHGDGHFYFSHKTQDSPRRWKALAERLFNEGLR